MSAVFPSGENIFHLLYRFSLWAQTQQRLSSVGMLCAPILQPFLFNSCFCSETQGFFVSGQLYVHACVHARSLQLCPALCDPMECSPPGSSVHRILQARILEWVAMPSSGESFRPMDRTHVSYISCIGRRVL